MSNIQEQITEIEKQMLELKAKVESLKQIKEQDVWKPNSLLFMNTDEQLNYYIDSTYGLNDTDCSIDNTTGSTDNFLNDGNVFQSEEIARHYAKAINTLLLLRRCEGSRPAGFTKQWSIDLSSGLHNLCIGVNYGVHAEFKMQLISPCFNTKENVLAAIEKIGKENIIHMFKTFHGIYE